MNILPSVQASEFGKKNTPGKSTQTGGQKEGEGGACLIEVPQQYTCVEGAEERYLREAK